MLLHSCRINGLNSLQSALARLPKHARGQDTQTAHAWVCRLQLPSFRTTPTHQCTSTRAQLQVRQAASPWHRAAVIFLQSVAGFQPSHTCAFSVLKLQGGVSPQVVRWGLNGMWAGLTHRAHLSDVMGSGYAHWPLVDPVCRCSQEHCQCHFLEPMGCLPILEP